MLRHPVLFNHPQDLSRDVLRIDAIPSTSLDSVREWLQSMDIRYYENKINLNWKPILKSILEDPEGGCCRVAEHLNG